MGTITDEQGKVMATVEVAEYAPGQFEGTVVQSNFPKGLMTLLREFEGLANGQIFSLLDEVEQKIQSYKLIFIERNAPISGLQLWGDDGIQFGIVG